MPKHKVKNILSVDWTTSNGLTPFYISPSDTAPDFYAVAIETSLSYADIRRAQNRRDIIRQGVAKILEVENKNTPNNVDSAFYSALIPSGPSGTFVPLRDFEKIKVLVKIPTADVDSLPTASYVRPTSYDTINLSSFRLSNRTKKVRDLLIRFDAEANDFDGKLYNINFQTEAERIEKFPALLKKLVRQNGFEYKESSSKNIVIGMSGSGRSSKEYLPVYIEYDSGFAKKDLTQGYAEFSGSDFITSNTMYIIKNMDEIEKTFAETAQITSANGVVPTGDTSNLGWEYFAKKYIRFPAAVITHDGGRLRSPAPSPQVEQIKKDTLKNPVKTLEQKRDEDRKLDSKKYQEKIQAAQKEIDYVGDATIGAIGKGIDAVQSIEDVYSIWLDKLGIRYVVEAAMKCLQIKLPFEEIKAFLRLANDFFEDIVEVLQIPTVSLPDLIPTVDIMRDLFEQVIVSVAEAVFNAIWGLLKQILVSLLENCGDISKANLGGIPIGEAFKKGGIGGLLNSTAGVLGQAAGAAALQGIETGFLNTSASSIKTQQFVSNLLTFVDQQKIQEFVDSEFRAIDETISLMSANLTPGEISRGLRGDPTPNVIAMTQNIALTLSEREYPTPGAATVVELLDTTEKVKDFYSNLGKIIDQDDILKQIENFDSFIPGLSNGLCDFDDSPQRKALLEGKGLTEDEAFAQIGASKDRARTALNQLESFLENPNQALQQAIPPFFCETDENGQITEGMTDLRHPSFMFMLQQTLDVFFDGAEIEFETDISRFPEMLKLQTFSKTDKITRTIISTDNFGTANIDGESRKINPEFKLAVLQGNDPDPPFNEYGAIEKDGGKFRPEIPATADGRELGLEQTIREAYEIDKEIEKGGPGAPKAFTKSIAENTFAPGLSGSYDNFQTDISLGPTALQNLTAREKLLSDKTVIEINTENQIKSLVQNAGNDSSFFLGLAARNPNFLSSIDIEKYTLISQQLKNTPPGEEKFAVLIRFNTQNNFYNSYKSVHNENINLGAQNVITDRGLAGSVSPEGSTKENHFVEFLSSIWTQGEKIYDQDLNELEPLEDKFIPAGRLATILRNFGGYGRFPFVDSFIKNQSDSQRVKSLYEELWRDLVAEFLTEVGNNNELLERSYDLLNLNPRSTLECKSPSIFGLRQIKQQVTKLYNERLYCRGLEYNIPETTGLKTNKDKSVEQSILYGVTKAFVRLHTIDVFLKSLITFNKLRFDEVDVAFIGFIEKQIVNDLKRLNFYYQFREEAVIAYNNKEGTNEGSFSVVLKSFIKEEIEYVGNLFVRISGARDRIENANSILSKIIKEYDVQEDGAVARPTIPTLQFTPRIEDRNNKGFTDWRNGNFYFEKYVRVKPKQFSGVNISLPSGVMSLAQFEREYETILNDRAFIDSILQISEVTKGTTEIQVGSNPNCDPIPPKVTEVSPAATKTVRARDAFMSDIFEYVRYGYRLVCQTTQTDRWDGISKNQIFEDIKQTAYTDNLDGQQVAQKNKSYYVSEQLTYKPNQQPLVEAFTFPIVSVEEEMDISNREVFQSSTLPGVPLIPGIQLEYGQVISNLRDKITETDEWSFIFSYCFPKNRAVSLAALYNITYFKSLGGLDTIFENTKQQLKLAFLSAYNSGLYQYEDEYTNLNFSQSFNQGDLPGLDLGKMGLMFIMSLLKSAGETFSPAIIIASKIKFAHEAAQKLASGAANLLGAGDSPDSQARREEAERRRSAAGLTNDLCKLTEEDKDFWEKYEEQVKNNELWPYVKYLFPVDLYFGAPGPPLTPLGHLYLNYDNIMNKMFKTGEQKEIERCNTNFEDVCPPDDEPTGGGN